MRIGINGSTDIALGAPLSQMLDNAVRAEEEGFASYWLAQLAAPDALTVLAMAGARTSRIELGTAVIPTWFRHPLMLAGQALTTQEATGNRVALGIGLAHKVSVEGTLRIPFATPARHMDEYLQVLLPALRDRQVDATGDIWSGYQEQLAGCPGATPPAVLLAAMGPRMLHLAGSRTDGTILWLSGPKVIAERIKPALDDAAAQSGRPPSRIVASVPVCVTSQPDAIRELISGMLAGYDALPSYKGVMDASGASGPADVSLVGSEEEVADGLRAFADAGATEFAAVELATTPDEATATRALLRDLATA